MDSYALGARSKNSSAARAVALDARGGFGNPDHAATLFTASKNTHAIHGFTNELCH